MTIDKPTLDALAGSTLGPASVRSHEDGIVLDILDRAVGVGHDASLVRCAAAVTVTRPGGTDPDDFDGRLRPALDAAERQHPDLVKLVHAPESDAVFCYAWLGVEGSVADLLATAHRCAGLTYLVERMVERTIALIGVEDELQRLETEVASLGEHEPPTQPSQPVSNLPPPPPPSAPIA